MAQIKTRRPILTESLHVSLKQDFRTLLASASMKHEPRTTYKIQIRYPISRVGC